MGYREVILADNPVNYWRLGETSGNAVDEMGVHNLVWSGTPVYEVTGALVGDANTAMELDGATEYASKSVANYRGGDNVGSIEFFVKLSAHGNYYTVFCSNDTALSTYYFAVIVSNGQLGLIHRNGGTASNMYSDTAMSLDTWHHCVVTSDGATCTMYVDGAVQTLIVTSGSNSGQWFADTSNRDHICIGVLLRNSLSNYLSGDVDEVAIYDTTLSSSQVLAHYNAAFTSLSGLRTILAQDYSLLGDVVRAALAQDYHLTFRLAAKLDQLYGLRLLAALVQRWGDLPALRAALVQRYGDCPVMRRLLQQDYGNLDQLRAAVEQVWDSRDGLRMAVDQRYHLASGPLRAALDQYWALQDMDSLRAVLHQLWVLAAGEAVVQQTAIAVVASPVQGYVPPLTGEAGWVSGPVASAYNINVEQDDGLYYMAGELQLADEAEFLACRHLQTEITLYLAGFVVSLLVGSPTDEPRIERSAGDGRVYVVPLASRTILLGHEESAHCRSMAESYSGMASAIVRELASPVTEVDWQLVDWFIPADILYVGDETRIDVIRKIVEAAGGILQTRPDGVLLCRPEYPVSVDRWATSTPDVYLTDQDDFFSISPGPSARGGYNEFFLSDQEQLTGGVTMDDESLAANRRQVRVWLTPWDESAQVGLLHSGGAWVQIIAQGVASEQVEEQVEFVGGAARTSKPVYGEVSVEWRHHDLGAVTAAEDGTLTAAESAHSLGLVSYTTRYHQFEVVDNEVEDVQVYPEVIRD